MGQVDLTSGVAKDTVAASWGTLIKRVKKVVDFSKETIGNGDVVALWRIPENTYVPGLTWRILTKEGKTLTVDLGAYTTAATWVEIDKDGFGDGIDLNTGTPPVRNSTWSHGQSEAYAASGGAYFPDGAYITLLCNNASANAAKIEITMLCIDNAHLDAVQELDALHA